MRTKIKNMNDKLKIIMILLIGLTIIGIAGIIYAAPPLVIDFGEYGQVTLPQSEYKDGKYYLHGLDLAKSSFAYCIEHGFSLTFTGQMEYFNRVSYKIEDGNHEKISGNITGVSSKTTDYLHCHRSCSPYHVVVDN